MTEQVYHSLDCLQHGKMNKFVFDWITKKFNLPAYNHSFRDTWAITRVWDGKISIIIDKRDESQLNLLNSIPEEYRGCKQYRTGIRVNLDSIYFDFDKEFTPIEYRILSKKIVHTQRHEDNDGDDFYVYSWNIDLADGTTICLTNQSKEFDISDLVIRTTIQQREFYKAIQN